MEWKGQYMNKFLKLLLGTSLYLLEQSDNTTKKARDRAAEHLDDLQDVARQKYQTAANRMARASRAIRGEDSEVLFNLLRFAAGVGVGIGVGLILAPASGEVTRSAIAGRVHEMGDKVRRQFSSEAHSATGTGD
jgi:gas vesicle protein